MENIYKIDKLHFSYGKKQIIKEMSFSIGHGDIVGLLGPNGAGKSTVINLLTGVIVNYSGDIFFKMPPFETMKLRSNRMLAPFSIGVQHMTT